MTRSSGYRMNIRDPTASYSGGERASSRIGDPCTQRVRCGGVPFQNIHWMDLLSEVDWLENLSPNNRVLAW